MIYDMSSSWLVEYSRVSLTIGAGNGRNRNQLSRRMWESFCVIKLKIKGNLFWLSFQLHPTKGSKPIYTIARSMIYELFSSKHIKPWIYGEYHRIYGTLGHNNVNIPLPIQWMTSFADQLRNMSRDKN